jgi:hypothetical protein
MILKSRDICTIKTCIYTLIGDTSESIFDASPITLLIKTECGLKIFSIG